MRKLCIFAAGFAAVIAGCVLLRPGAMICLAGAIFALAGLVLFFLPGKTARRAAIFCLGLCLGFLRYAAYRQFTLAPALRVNEQTLSVSAVATDYPRQTRYGSSVAAELTLEGKTYDAVVYLRETDAEIRPGDTLSLMAQLELTQDEADETGTYLRSRGTILLAKARSAVFVSSRESIPLRFYPAQLAHLLRQSVNALFPEDVAGFLCALLTGQRDILPTEVQIALSNAGIYHVVAVSGMHVSILLGMILLLCRSRRRLAACIGVPVVFVFVLMTGASASAVRAGCMQILLLLAPLVRRENDPPTSIMAALTLLLTVNPYSVLDVGLQLSFSSITGILLFSGGIYRQLSTLRPLRRALLARKPVSWLARTMLSAFSCSLGSAALSFPLLALHFGTVSLIAPLTNTLCLWAVTLIFTLGLLICLAALVFGQLLAGPAWLLSFLVRGVLGLSSLLARLPLAALYLENGYMWLLATAYYAAVLRYALRPKAGEARILALALALVFAVGLPLSYLDYHLPSFCFTAVDVGQGQCLIYRSGSEVCMIDCGGTQDDSGELAARFLQANGVYRVQALILTHYDADHANGVCQLLRRCRVQRLYLPDVEDETQLRAQIEAQAERSGCEIIFVRDDMQLPLGRAGVQIFAPVSTLSSNDCGLSCLLSQEEYDILITGDMTQQAEWRLLSLHELPQIELLVVGHHGSKSSTSEALLALTRPRCAIISVGKNNSFSHPAQQTLLRLARAGTAVYRTDESGTITIRG